jgi:BirA family biotin operon repressor/biotin-[acetyl-CoA-carboxylase] ligase
MANKSLSVAKIQKGLATGIIGRNLRYYPRLASTMETARQVAQQGAAEGTVVIAGEQTAGRGRLKRAWLSPGGNITLSIVLYPEISTLPYLVMIASLAATYAIESATGLQPQIKWPNDVLIRRKKAAGILIENEVRGSQAARAVVGIGINVALQAAGFQEIAATATSLESELGKKISREDVIIALLTEFERWYRKLPERDAIFQAWRGRLATLGQKVTATWGEETIRGVAESVDESGALWIRRTDGVLTKVVAGDVTLSKQ